jgi:hypothetical protein
MAHSKGIAMGKGYSPGHQGHGGHHPLNHPIHGSNHHTNDHMRSMVGRGKSEMNGQMDAGPSLGAINDMGM